jgi:hypothetical protein
MSVNRFGPGCCCGGCSDCVCSGAIPEQIQIDVAGLAGGYSGLNSSYILDFKSKSGCYQQCYENHSARTDQRCLCQYEFPGGSPCSASKLQCSIYLYAGTIRISCGIFGNGGGDVGTCSDGNPPGFILTWTKLLLVAPPETYDCDGMSSLSIDGARVGTGTSCGGTNPTAAISAATALVTSL